MKFWGVDVSSKPSKVTLEQGSVLHISQATLGATKKDNETVTLYIEIGEEKQKFVLGMLSKNTPQLSFDLVFDQAFEISHNWKSGSVHLLGYQIEKDAGFDDEISSDEDEEAMVLPSNTIETHKVLAPAKLKKADNGKPAEEDVDDDSSDPEDSSDDDTAMTMSDDSDEDEDSEEDDEDDSEDEKPTKVENGNGKKRPNADVKTPDSKKAKVVTPKKTDGKKEVHSATPHPAKKGGKTPGGNKVTPKSGSQCARGSCCK